MIMSNRYALDTNVLIYLHDIDSNSHKRNIAEELVADGPVISPQVISEYLNVCHKRLKMSKPDTLEALMNWLNFCTLADFSLKIYSRTIDLVEKYQFQLFDGIVVAYALASDCDKLYSEDMQNNLLVESQLRIVNPFL